MRKSIHNITSALLLISSLLFTQLAVNFFHRNHDVHEVKSSVAKKNAAPEWHQHDEHCKICSIDFFNHSFDHYSLILFSSISDETCYGFSERFFYSASQSYFKGRAPPVA